MRSRGTGGHQEDEDGKSHTAWTHHGAGRSTFSGVRSAAGSAFCEHKLLRSD